MMFFYAKAVLRKSSVYFRSNWHSYMDCKGKTGYQVARVELCCRYCWIRFRALLVCFFFFFFLFVLFSLDHIFLSLSSCPPSMCRYCWIKFRALFVLFFFRLAFSFFSSSPPFLLFLSFLPLLLLLLLSPFTSQAGPV